MRVVLDTNVLISATLWDESVSQKLLFELINSGCEIFVSAEILAEYQRVLKRDFGYADKNICLIINKILRFSSLVVRLEKIELVKDDPEDDKIVSCAVSSSSDYIITYDKHLLRLREFKWGRILTPDEFLRLKSD